MGCIGGGQGLDLLPPAPPNEKFQFSKIDRVKYDVDDSPTPNHTINEDWRCASEQDPIFASHCEGSYLCAHPYVSHMCGSRS